MLCCPYGAGDILGLEPGVLPPAMLFQPYQAEDILWVGECHYSIFTAIPKFTDKTRRT